MRVDDECRATECFTTEEAIDSFGAFAAIRMSSDIAPGDDARCGHEASADANVPTLESRKTFDKSGRRALFVCVRSQNLERADTLHLVEQSSAESRDLSANAGVSSYNEWDPLEEVIVGSVEGAMVPPWHVSLQATMPEQHWPLFQRQGGRAFDAELVVAAQRNLEEFVGILEAEGVRVRRPDHCDFSAPFSTPHWTSSSGLYAAMPRDSLLLWGDEILEAPMSWRCRYHEVTAYRRLIREYFHLGAHWSAAPKPQLLDASYAERYEPQREAQGLRYVFNEDEPIFDAADFVRCGRDLFVQRSHTTNATGIEWVRRHFARRCRVHEVEVVDSKPMHIDATLVPLAPGKVLVNPERVKNLHPLFRSWDVLTAPAPRPSSTPLLMSSSWLSINVLSLDEKRVIVEKQEHDLIQRLRAWGFQPISCNFRGFYAFGGSFHCATLDVRRRGAAQSYF